MGGSDARYGWEGKTRRLDSDPLLGHADDPASIGPDRQGVQRKPMSLPVSLDVGADAPQRLEKSAPTSLGRFRVIRELGRGGTGTVYEAIDDQLARTVAIKVLPPGEPEFHARLLNEARAVNIIRHRGIVSISDVERLADGSSFLVMDYLEGETLRSLLRHLPPLTDLLRFTRQVAGALAAAHRKGILHRDLKPENDHRAAVCRIPTGFADRGTRRNEIAA